MKKDITIKFGRDCSFEYTPFYKKIIYKSKEHSTIILDLTQTEFINSSVIGLCLNFQNEMKAQNKEVRFKLNNEMREIFSIGKILNLIIEEKNIE